MRPEDDEILVSTEGRVIIHQRSYVSSCKNNYAKRDERNMLNYVPTDGIR